MKKNIIVFGKITGIGWFVVILIIVSVLLGRWVGDKIGLPILFASLSGLIGVVISILGIRASIKDILNRSPMTAYENDNLQVAHERMKEARLQSLVVKNSNEKIVGIIQIFK